MHILTYMELFKNGISIRIRHVYKTIPSVLYTKRHETDQLYTQWFSRGIKFDQQGSIQKVYMDIVKYSNLSKKLIKILALNDNEASSQYLVSETCYTHADWPIRPS